jgi:hypothetical protein
MHATRQGNERGWASALAATAGQARPRVSGTGQGHGSRELGWDAWGTQAAGEGRGWATRRRWAAGRPREGRGKKPDGPPRLDRGRS